MPISLSSFSSSPWLGVWGLGFGVRGPGFGVWGLESGAWGLGFRGWGSVLCVSGFGILFSVFWFRASGLAFRVSGLGCRSSHVAALFPPAGARHIPRLNPHPSAKKKKHRPSLSRDVRRTPARTSPLPTTKTAKGGLSWPNNDILISK